MALLVPPENVHVKVFGLGHHLTSLGQLGLQKINTNVHAQISMDYRPVVYLNGKKCHLRCNSWKCENVNGSFGIYATSLKNASNILRMTDFRWNNNSTCHLGAAVDVYRRPLISVPTHPTSGQTETSADHKLIYPRVGSWLRSIIMLISV